MDYEVDLGNGWRAFYRHKGEFKMGCDYWDLSLRSQDGIHLNYFENTVVLVNDSDGSKAKAALRLSDSRDIAFLRTGMGEEWIIRFSDQKLAPYRLYIRHHVGSKHLSAYEQPAYKMAQEYVTVEGGLLYITFPFLSQAEIGPELQDYLQIRRNQLESTYFRS